MNRNWLVAGAVVLVVLVVGVVVAAVSHRDWRDRHDDRVVQVVDGTSGEPLEPGQVVRVVDDHDGRHFGFFPFGLFLWPLFIVGLIFLIGALFRRGPGSHGPGGWGGDGRLDDWHRRQHSAGDGPAAPTANA